ncbi:MAG: nucleotidyltransferase domain-containing protein [Deltaproteobacteria bacterium]|nr:nucleotidyltransferase domain-containing protein [Deltaproteobacteria bacterium]MBW1930169.1 nucleotidyltransferase domain-containing protein [Deltaproteobacteria bacterium]MBW2024911.1 nucleotidyltransferase domain-containing protein [Deltaproteobacteria bacterium]MBW2124941.1 nucleotidyltransferase domain-containing protein [Deltaproteobacteria bacterium]RLB17159.1 MAG: toxin-antitoxin system toxin subunit [Deltaproteobacteria bacterium]
MNLLSEIFSSKARAEILRLLFGPSHQELHVREIERRAGMNIRTIRHELRKLHRLDLVIVRKDGNRLYYKANIEHPIYIDLRNIVLKTSGLVEILQNTLGKEGICVAFIFGSLARGDTNARSDVDLMVIGDIGLRSLASKLPSVSEQIGREITPHVMTVSEFEKRKKAGEHFLARVLESPKLFIVGSEDDLRAMEGKRLA